MIKKLLAGEDAQSTVEYVIIAAIMAIFGLGAVKLFSTAFASSFNRTKSIRSGVAGMAP